jgi:hypothetical protein
MSMAPQAEMVTLLEWTKAKLAKGEEPPWSWYQLMKLRETLEAILAGMAATTTESSPQSAHSPGKHLRLVDSTDPQDASPPRPSGFRYSRPCDPQRALAAMGGNGCVVAVGKQVRLDIALPNANDATGLAIVPNDVNALRCHLVEGDVIEAQPVVLSALDPLKLKHCLLLFAGTLN